MILQTNKYIISLISILKYLLLTTSYFLHYFCFNLIRGSLYVMSICIYNIYDISLCVICKNNYETIY